MRGLTKNLQCIDMILILLYFTANNKLRKYTMYVYILYNPCLTLHYKVGYTFQMI